ncbi:MAG: hypothetical protein J6J24_04510 [Clostridia bacterium]|nr:hypothetical protein [Clostridia bacterium]
MRKIYFTTKGYNENANDFSFYGIFAEVKDENGKTFFARQQCGSWQKVSNYKQISYYEKCKKLDLIDYLNRQGRQTVRLFRRTEPREIGYVNGVAVSEYVKQYGFSAEKYQDKQFLNENICVAALLPDGSMLAIDNSAFEKKSGAVIGLPIRVVDKRYVKDKKFILQKTDIMAEPKDIAIFLEDELDKSLKEKMNESSKLEKD